MGDSVGSVSLDLLLNSKEFESKLNNAVNKATKNINTNMNKGLGNTGALLGKIGKLAAAAFSIRAITNFSKECVNLGSDLAEVRTLSNTVFGAMSDDVDKWASKSIENMGLSETSAKKYASTIASIFKSAGGSGKEIYDVSTNLTQLVADFSSFYNLNHSEAFEKIKAGLVGSSEPLLSLGIDLREGATEAFALSKGLTSNYKALSNLEKMQIRYQYLLAQTTDAQGDFIRNQNSWSVQTKILSENFNKLKSSLGQGLINALLPVIKVINSLMGKLQILAEMFSNFTAKVFGKAETSTSSITSTITDLGNEAAATGDAIGGIADSASEAAKKMNKTTFGFDELNTLQAPDDSSGGGAGGVGDVGAGITSSTTEQQKLNNESSVYETILDKLIKKAKELADLFTKGFKFGLETTNFDGAIENIKTSINSIKKSLFDIFGDGQVLGALDNLVNTIASTLGSMIGTTIGVGASIGNALLGGIAEYLESNSGFLKEKFTIILDGLTESVSIIGQIFSDIGQIISDTFNSSAASTLISDFISVIVNPFLELGDFIIQIFNDIFGGVADFINRYKEEITTGLENTFTIVSDILKGAETVILDVIGILKGAYETYVVPVLENLGSKINYLMDNYIIPLGNTFVECWNKIKDNLAIIWETWLKPFVKWFIENLVKDITDALNNIINIGAIFVGRITQFVDGMIRIISGIIDFLVGVFTGDWDRVWQGIKDIFKGFLVQIESIAGVIIDLIAEIFGDFLRDMKDSWTNTWNSIKDFFSGIGTSISNIVNSIVKTGSDLIGRFCNFIKNSFSSAGDGIKSVFKGVYDVITSIFGSLVNVIRTPVNSIIGIINKAIDGINSLSIDVPDWVPVVGGENYSFNLPKIPALANGGYITAPQLAMVGEAEPEIVAPESKLREIRDEGTTSTNLLLTQMVEQNKQLINIMNLLLNKDQDLYLDKDKVGSLINGYNLAETRRRG